MSVPRFEPKVVGAELEAVIMDGDWVNVKMLPPPKAPPFDVDP